jgi:hypothetical protein
VKLWWFFVDAYSCTSPLFTLFPVTGPFNLKKATPTRTGISCGGASQRPDHWENTKIKKMKKVLVIVDFKGGSKEQYDASVKDLASAGQLKLPQRPHHFAGIAEDGMYIVDIWDSEESFAKFGEVMVPIIIKNGMQPPQVRVFPLHNELD